MRKLLLIGRRFRGRKSTVVDLRAFRELKGKRKEPRPREKTSK